MAVELALEGNALALKLCLDRLSAPRRDMNFRAWPDDHFKDDRSQDGA